jgi:hypothetical protein
MWMTCVALQISSPWELGVVGDGEGGNASDLYSIYLRGEASLAAHEARPQPSSKRSSTIAALA